MLEGFITFTTPRRDQDLTSDLVQDFKVQVCEAWRGKWSGDNLLQQDLVSSPVGKKKAKLKQNQTLHHKTDQSISVNPHMTD